MQMYNRYGDLLPFPKSLFPYPGAGRFVVYGSDGCVESTHRTQERAFKVAKRIHGSVYDCRLHLRIFG